MPITFYDILLFTPVILSLFLIFYAVSNRKANRGVADGFIVLMAGVFVWSFGYFIQLHTGRLDLIQGLTAMRYIGITTVPVGFLIFAVRYTRGDQWITRRNLALLTIEPVITVIVAYLNPVNLMYTSAVLRPVGTLYVLDTSTGLWFWIHSVYSYGLLFLGLYLVLRNFGRSLGLYRLQIASVIIGFLAPLIANALTIFDASPFDLTPFAFTITGLSLGLGMLRLRLLDIVPVARERVFDQMAEAVMVLDGQGRVLDINPAARALVPNPQNIVGQLALDAIPQISNFPTLLERIRAQNSLSDELTLETPGGERQTFELRVSALYDANGQLSGRLIVLHDVTARKRAEQQIQHQNEVLKQTNIELAQARKEAEQAAKLKTEFLTTMSHELRTPLNAVIGYTEIQMQGIAGDLTPEQMEMQQRVLANAEHLLQMINDVLDVAKIEAGHMDINPEQFVVKEWIEAIFTQMKVLADIKNLAFQLQIDPALPQELIGDPLHLKQIVVNLVSNAIKFTDIGDVVLKLGRVDSNRWSIQVTDTGPGIPMNMIEHIFEEFRQVDGTAKRKHGGTGLGLSIVRKLASLLGGTVEVRTEVDKGSTFTVVLPIVLRADKPLTDARPIASSAELTA